MKSAAVLLAGLCAASAWADGAGTVTASSEARGLFAARFAFDGRVDTRWASDGAKRSPEWLAIDLGEILPVDTLAVRWEAAFAADYAIEVSDDGKIWREVARRADGKGGREAFNKLGARGRHVRIACRKPGPHGLYSIWEVEFGDAAVQQALARAAAARDTAARGALAATLSSRGGREIVFAARENGQDGHWYANFSYYAQDAERKCYKKHGRLVKLDLETGATTNLVDDPGGSVRDPAVHYDGRTIVFS
ncbi:MAG: discoidin domain-containing protein, partial [Verrucomicrobia bacterium]|nr:discoidin domain-containing protein [Verrucomicrobiota bacterium]